MADFPNWDDWNDLNNTSVAASFSGIATTTGATLADGKIFSWNAQNVAILTAIVTFTVVGFLLNASIVVAIAVGKIRKVLTALTGIDVLIINHAVINVLIIVLTIPWMLTVRLVSNDRWLFAHGFCHPWGFFRGWLYGSSGTVKTLVSKNRPPRSTLSTYREL